MKKHAKFIVALAGMVAVVVNASIGVDHPLAEPIIALVDAVAVYLVPNQT